MKNLRWFVLGIIGGFVAAHLINKDPRGHELFEQVDARITEFTDRMSDAYRDQQNTLHAIVEDATASVVSAAESAQQTN
ncbi:ATPase [Microbacterium sp. NC79]|uniref:ATPase n=1 Tax=Microbacterium sp. NC79 TaxID=2851009 RepID=UPI001C2C3EAA|nr:ATPase [Microbacterium sp. NC79]MBV0894944.1 ATPase [Microbacterium sp. NC79]